MEGANFDRWRLVPLTRLYRKGVVHKWRHDLRGRGSLILWQQYLGHSTKTRDNGGGGVINCSKLRDVLYGRPQRGFWLGLVRFVPLDLLKFYLLPIIFIRLMRCGNQVGHSKFCLQYLQFTTASRRRKPDLVLSCFVLQLTIWKIS